MIKTAKAFVIANDKSPVVYGAVIGKGGQGGRYTLDDGTLAELRLAESIALPKGYPKWKI